MSNAGQTQRDEQFSGFRAAINHVAAWSIRWVDLDAMLNDHVMMDLAEREAAIIGATAAEAHQEVSLESLKRLRLRPMCPGIRAIESGGFRNPSWCEHLLSLADELHHALVQMAVFRNWDVAGRLAVKIANIEWPLVRQELDAELSWLAANPTSSPGDAVEPKWTAGDVTVPDRVALEPAMSAERPIKLKATAAKAPNGTPGRKPDDKKQRHAEYANELRSQTPQKTWKDCATAVNEKFTLTGDDKYTLKSIRSPWRLHFGDKSKKKKRD